MITQAVIFDMDGVIVDTETIWNNVFNEFFRLHGGTFTDEFRAHVMGSSSEFWSSELKKELSLGNDWSIQKIADWNLDRVHEEMNINVDLLPGYTEVISLIKQMDIRLGLASGATQKNVDFVLNAKGIADDFEVAISSSGVGKPKPAPDVYLEVAKQMDMDPTHCVGIEDSPNGVRSVIAAAMKCIAIPNELLSDNNVFSQADVVRKNLSDITSEDFTIY